MTASNPVPTTPAASNARWLAIVNRDARFDHQFVFAVTTTGIYCRPSCPARRPKPENTAFFDSPEDAERAGYRPCLRCTPRGQSLAARRLEAVKKACAIIESAEQPPSLNQLAAAVNLSPAHFHRQFKRVTGVTPKQYATGKRIKRLQDRLQADRPVTDAIYEAGFGASSRVYESAKQTLGMAPAKYRAGGKGQSIRYTTAESALGLFLVAATDSGVCCIEFGASQQAMRQSLGKRFPAARLREDTRELRRWVEAVAAYIRTPSLGLELPLDIQGTAFQQRVWQALQAIPPGQTATYSEIAQAIGKPAAHRAVAQACAANKVALAIPCHRVVRTNGGLGGYRWGIDKKRYLLAHEEREPPPGKPLDKDP